MKRFSKYCSFLFLIPLMVVGLFLAMPSVDVSAALLPYSVSTPRDDFPIREKPNTYSEVLISLPKGIVLYPVVQEKSWYKVPFKDGVYGYVHKDYITSAPTAANTVLFPGTVLRASMSTTGEKVSLLSVNTEVSLTGYDGDWFQATVYGSNSKGYLHRDSLKIPEKVLIDTEDPIDIVHDTKVRANTKANVRSGPGTNYSIVTTVTSGTVMTVLGQAKDRSGKIWYQVSVHGLKGYIRSDLVDKLAHTEGLNGVTIVIDPGHGSIKSVGGIFDSGFVGPTGVMEKDVTMAVARYLKAHLEYEGAEVTMTRSGDADVLSFSDRTKIANDLNADLFISIHCNFYISSSVSGTETYYYGGTSASPIDSNLANNRKKLATAVQQNLVTDLGRVNRGVNTANYAVLVGTTMPSILTELMFISNSEEEKLLANPTVQENAAKAIVKGVLSYYGK